MAVRGGKFLTHPHWHRSCLKKIDSQHYSSPRTPPMLLTAPANQGYSPGHLCTYLMLTMACLCLVPTELLAHGVEAGDKAYIQTISGPHVIPFIYLGAKHMVTGYDHILFLIAVIFFLYKTRDVFLYVSLFAVGHSITLLAGVYFELSINSYLIDAIIGLSIVYKALDNLGAFKRWFGVQPNTKIATFLFGLCHGFGLATKILDYNISPNGLLPNLIAFNIGVEIGQIVALCAVLILMAWWRSTRSFSKLAYSTNVLIMCAGFILTGLHLAGYILNT